MPKPHPVAGTELGLITGGLDQPAPLPGLPAILETVDRVIDQSISEHKPALGLNLIAQLHDLHRLSGLALAITLYKLGSRWIELGMQETFEDEVFTKTGLAPGTLRRYVPVGAWFEALPKSLRDTFASRPIRDLIAMVQAVTRHGDFSTDELRELSQASDNSELRARLAELTGREKSSVERLLIYLRRDGRLEAQDGRHRRVTIGVLRKSPDDLADPTRAKAIARLVAVAGILEE